MYRSLLAGITLIFIQACHSIPAWPEVNPALEKYQDESQCFPLAESWYTVYRNYESDPVLGGTAKCLKDYQSGPAVDGEFPVVFEFGDQQSLETLVTFESSEGYSGLNVVKARLPQGDDIYVLYVAYLNCKKCVLIRNTYVDDDSCALLVPESELGHHSTECDFIFDLLCGVGAKYNISDASCITQG